MAARGNGSVWVAGAEGALGREAVIALNRLGYSVNATARTEADRLKLDEFLTGQNAAGIRTHTCNLASDSDVAKCAAALDDKAPIGYVFNCAGGFRWNPAIKATEEEFDFLMDANLRSSWLLSKHVLPRMIKRNYGRIVFISARATQGVGEVGMGLYAASKAGLNALTQSLGQEMKPYNINVNALMPTIIDTPANRKDMPDRDHSGWVKPLSLIHLAHMLFSDYGEQINGALIPVPGRV